MALHPGEPVAGPWAECDDRGLAAALREACGPSPAPLVLVDGGSGCGKSTVAESAARALGGALVHTDDLAWHHDALGWADLLIDDIIAPWRDGRAIAYRPPGWVHLGREGALTVPAGRGPLIVEGVGAGRATLAPHADLVMWVQCDRDVARARGLARDVSLGRSPAHAEAFWDEWMSSELPFLTADRPWERAGLIVDGNSVRGAGHALSDCTRLAVGPLAHRPGPSTALS